MTDKIKQKNLENKGWKIGSADEFFNLTAEESNYAKLYSSQCAGGSSFH